MGNQSPAILVVGLLTVVVGITIFMSACVFLQCKFDHYLFKRRRRPKSLTPYRNVSDPEASQRVELSSQQANFSQVPRPEEHPPIYCIEDLHEPPPVYRAAGRARPTAQELERLKARLAWLERGRGTDRHELHRSIREVEIASLNMWIGQLEVIDGIPLEALDGFVMEEEEEVLPSTRRQTIMRETGWVGVGLPREVRMSLDDHITSIEKRILAGGLSVAEAERLTKDLARLKDCRTVKEQVLRGAASRAGET